MLAKETNDYQLLEVVNQSEHSIDAVEQLVIQAQEAHFNRQWERLVTLCRRGLIPTDEARSLPC